MYVSRPSPAMVPGRHQDSAGVPAKTRLRERVEIGLPSRESRADVEPHAGPPADCDGPPLRLSAMLEAIKPMTRGAPSHWLDRLEHRAEPERWAVAVGGRPRVRFHISPRLPGGQPYLDAFAQPGFGGYPGTILVTAWDHRRGRAGDIHIPSRGILLSWATDHQN